MPAEALHIELLHSCRLRCLACDHRLSGPARLTLSRLRPVLADPRFRALKLVSFSGGEPLLHPRLRDFMLRAAGSFPGAALILLTSLFEGERTAELLRSLPPAVLGRLHIGSSLDGPPAVHDAMRGRPGAFGALKKNLAALKREFPGLSAGLTFTATSGNAAHFHAAWLEARAMGAPLGIQFLVPNANTGRLELKPADRKALRSGLKRAMAGAGTSGKDGLRPALDFLEGSAPAGGCGAGRSFFMLSPDGRFYLCPFHKELTAALSAVGGLRKRLAGRAALSCRRCFLRCRGRAPSNDII